MSRRLIGRCVAMRDRGWAATGLAAIGLALALGLLLPGPARPAETRPLPRAGVARIRKALDQKTEVDFAEQPLAEVVAAIAHRHEIEVQLDVKALEEEGVGTETPISRQIKNVSLESALRLLLRDLDLTYIVRDGYLLITTKAEAEALISVRAYPVGDLLGADDGLCSPLAPGDRIGAVSGDFQQLIDAITTTVAPTTWDAVGGPGTIEEVRPSDALAIGQTDEVHREIVDLLASLRVVRDKQLKAAQAIARDVPEEKEVAESEMPLTTYRILPDPMAAKPPVKQAKPVANVGDAAAGNAGKPAAPPPAPPQPAGSPPDPVSDYSAEDRLATKVAKIAALLPELIEPESWQPHGAGMARAIDDTIVVRQTEEVQRRVAALLTEMAPGRVVYWRRAGRPPKLAVAGPRRDWPQQAEPLTEPYATFQRALDAAASIEVADRPLSEVVEQIKAEHELPIHIDVKALEEEGVGTETPVSRNIHGIPLRELLHLLMNDLDLTYVIHNEVLMITTKAEAEAMLTTRVYPVFDLACLPRGKGEGAGPGLWAKLVLPGAMGAGRPRGRDHTGTDYASLINGLTASIAPTTWDDVGGPGAVMGFAPAGALIISQTTEVHEEIAQYLKALRDVAEERMKDEG